MVINILSINDNPNALDRLKTFLLEQIAKGNTHWVEKIPDQLTDGTDVLLSHSLLLRPRKSEDKKGWRLEVFNENDSTGKGAYGSVYKNVGTLVLTEDLLFMSCRKPRVIKFFYQIPTTMPVEIPHLHSKKLAPVRPSIAGRASAMVMKFFSGTTLEHYLHQPKSSLRADKCCQLTLNLLRTYVSQIGAFDHIHRDIKPANIMIDNRGNLKIDFIDYDSAVSLSMGKNLTQPPPCFSALFSNGS